MKKATLSLLFMLCILTTFAQADKDVTAIQSAYFANIFKDFDTPTVLAEFQKQSVSETVESLTESGINEIRVYGTSL